MGPADSWALLRAVEGWEPQHSWSLSVLLTEPNRCLSSCHTHLKHWSASLRSENPCRRSAGWSSDRSAQGHRQINNTAPEKEPSQGGATADRGVCRALPAHLQTSLPSAGRGGSTIRTQTRLLVVSQVTTTAGKQSFSNANKEIHV